MSCTIFGSSFEPAKTLIAYQREIFRLALVSAKMLSDLHRPVRGYSGPIEFQASLTVGELKGAWSQLSYVDAWAMSDSISEWCQFPIVMPHVM